MSDERNFEEVPVGMNDWLEGNGPEVELRPLKKRPIAQFVDGTEGLQLHGMPSYELLSGQPELQDKLSKLAMQLGKKRYDALPSTEKGVTSVGALAIAAYQELLAQIEKPAPPIADPRTALPPVTGGVQSGGRLMRLQPKTTKTTYVEYDLGLDGLGSTPTEGGINVELTFFLATGERVTREFVADWVIVQSEDSPRLWTLVFDGRKESTNNLPDVPKMPQNQCRLVCSDGTESETILAVQAFLTLQIGVFTVWVIGE